MSYTKGPWKVVENDDGDAAIAMGSALDSPEHYSCRDYWTSEAEYGEQGVMANAHLIAAAPDMYEALKRMVENNEGYVCGFDNPCKCPRCQAMTAIAKADGREVNDG